ncbi:expressed unknown protein [Seminavis robusta]|uniref:Uncharacterized protein n=1 Tax=Seminavis robusta TaxID=568900 RepID=A0A9N8HTV0_9STRA|nr:expressed unknown protein [Seminavis robusta]|eukprot:Sro1319_g262240.1 n/a (457) ;mRNA; f:503-1959
MYSANEHLVDDDGESQNMSEDSAFNRYNPMGFSDAASDVVPDTFEAELDAFQSLLVGGASTERNDLSIPANVSLDDSGIVNMGGAGKGSRSGDMSSSQRSKSGVSSSSDWDLSSTQSGKTTMYGYGLELDEWKRKKNIALWQPESSAKALVKRGPFFACQTLALQAVADELNGLLFVHPPNRLQSAKAVQNMIERTKESRKRQEVMDLMRHVPEANTSNPRPWQLPYRERCKNSAGYLGVDQYSLIDTASALRVFDSRDVSPWESRDVLQHFLDEQSISLTHNWFGNLRRKRGNDKIKYKPARPSSMPIPTEPSLQSASEEMDDWTEVLSKASKSWKDDEVNRTASMSVSSEESTSQSCDDETTSRFASTNRSERTHSVTFRSSVLTSSQSTTEAKTYNSSTIDHVLHGNGTETSTGTSTSSGSGSGQRSGVASMSVDDDIESTGVARSWTRMMTM